jgi:predicted GIY-YIG superfamily endonuclease
VGLSIFTVLNSRASSACGGLASGEGCNESRVLMYAIYVIESLKNGKRYTGFTGKNPEQRLAEHNRGCNKWARENRPFRLIYKEFFEIERKARQREKFLKSGKGRRLISTIIPR